MKRVLAAVVTALVMGGVAQAADKKVERTWKAKCSACHGMDGKGQTEKGKKMSVADMSTKTFQATTEDNWKKAILEGVKKENKEMDGFKEDLKPGDLEGLIAYIKELGAK